MYEQIMTTPPWNKTSNELGFAFGFQAMCSKIWSFFLQDFLVRVILYSETVQTRTFMVTHNHLYTPLSEISQCFKICIWFPCHVFKDTVLFSALQSLSKSIQTQNRGN